MTTTCPACGRESGTSWRCEYCGHDLVDEDDDDGSAAPPLLADGGQSDTMGRVTFRVPEQLLEQFEDAAEGEYYSRSEALREAMRAFVRDSGPDNPHSGSGERSFLRTDGGERGGPSDLSDDELLERLAGQDHALAPVAENALQEEEKS